MSIPSITSFSPQLNETNFKDGNENKTETHTIATENFLAEDNKKIINKTKLLISQEKLENSTITLPIQNFLAGNEAEATEISQHMHKHWLKDMVLRVLTDPLLALDQCIHNSLDAVNPNHPIGGHGIGFLSILSFLKHPETNGCEIDIRTTISIEGTNYSYQMLIFEKNDMPYVTFKKLPAQEKTGTEISILPNQGFFSHETLNQLNHYLLRLQFYPYGQIAVSTNDTQFSIGNGDIRVNVILKSEQLIVSDHGPGIPLEIASSVLFVPTISTKKSYSGNSKIEDPKFVHYLAKRDDFSHFIVAVNGVVVIDLSLSKILKQGDILLTLPEDTLLTVARNALQMEGKTKCFLKTLIEKIIEKMLTREIESELVYALYISFIAWEQDTPALLNWRLSSTIQQLLSKEIFAENAKWILFPVAYTEFLMPIFSLLADPKLLLPLSTELIEGNIHIIENRIKKLFNFHFKNDSIESIALNGGIINAKQLIFVSDKFLPRIPGSKQHQISSLGFTNLLFVPLSILEIAKQTSKDLEKELAFCISTRYIENGKTCQPSILEVQENLSFFNFASSKNFLVTTSMKSTDLHQNIFLNRGPTGFLDALNQTQLVGSPFEEFIKKNGLNVAYFVHDFFNIDEFANSDLHSNFQLLEAFPEAFLSAMADVTKDFNSYEEKRDFYITVLENMYFFNETEIQFYKITPQKTKLLIEYITNVKEKKWSEKLFLLEESDEYIESSIEGLELINQGFLVPIPHESVGKRIFEWLLGRAGINKLEDTIQIYSKNEKIWPPEKISLEYLEKLYAQMLDASFVYHDYAKNFDSQGNDSFKILINEHEINSINSETWHLLDAFSAMENQILVQKNSGTFFNIFFPTYLIRDKLLFSNLITQDSKHILKVFFNKLHGIFLHYLTFANHEIPSVYGRTDTLAFFFHNAEVASLNSNSCFFTSQPESVVQFLIQLSHLKVEAVDKLLYLIENFYNETLSIGIRNEKLLRKESFPVFSIHQFNALALISKLYSKGYAIEFLIILIENTRSHNDLNLMCELLLKNNLHHHFNSLDHQIAKIELLTCVHLSVQHILDPLKFSATHTFFRHFLEAVNYSKDFNYKALSDFLKIKSSAEKINFPQFINDKIVKKFENTPAFTTYQIMNSVNSTLFKKYIDNQDLESVVKEISTTKIENNNSRTIEHSVEAATARDSYVATTLESLQNSLDAIISYFKKYHGSPQDAQSRLDLQLGFSICHCKNSKHMMFEIIDPIGMKNLETLLVDFLIPNYSTKKKEDGLVGEMGNGASQVDKDAEQQSIITRPLDYPDRVFFLRKIPIRKEGRVVDIQLKCVDVTDLMPNFKGTTIRVLFKEENISDTNLELKTLIANHYIRSVVSKTSVTIPNTQYRPNLFLKMTSYKELLSAYASNEMPLHLKYSEVALHLKSSNENTYDFKFLPLSDKSEDGYVLLNGYPFKLTKIFFLEKNLLHPDFIDEYSKGWCLYLPVGSYTPVQSRTHIHLTPEAIKQLKKFIAEYVYVKLFCEKKTTLAEKYLLHFASAVGNFRQVYPNSTCYLSQDELVQSLINKPHNEDAKSVLQRFYAHYVPYFSKKSFTNYFEDFSSEVDKYFTIKSDCLKILQLAIQTQPPEAFEKNYQTITTNFFTQIDQHFLAFTKSLETTDLLNALYIRNMILGWIQPKLNAFKKEIPTIQVFKDYNAKLKSQLEITEDKLIEQQSLSLLSLPTFEAALKWMGSLKDQAQIVVNSYLSAYTKMQNINRTFKVEFQYNSVNSFRAAYNHDSSTIVINAYVSTIFPIIDFAIGLVEKNNLRSFEGADLFLVNLFKSGVINHELEHARRAVSCGGKDTHNPGIDPWGHMVHFEACSSGFAATIHQQGLFEILSAEFQNLFNLSQLKIDRDKLKALQTAHPQFVLKLLRHLLLTFIPDKKSGEPDTKKQKLTDTNVNS